jgi:predicted transcriptional regulator
MSADIRGQSFSIYIEPALRERAAAQARRMDRSVAWVVREAMRLYLASVEPRYVDPPTDTPGK